MAGELILYTTEDGAASVRLRADGGTVWLSQLEMAELFQTSVPNINIHIKNILDEGELPAEATIKEDLIVRQEGGRQVRRPVKFYNLDMILAVGYRVRSLRGTQFRQWATTHLREYLVKGFVMDDERLKEPGGWDYFDELLERIRDIRASEKRFYQKVRDIYATAVDYDPKSEAAQLFFKKVQNKMLWAVTGHTAAELISGRADPALPNMGLTSFKGSRVRQGDVTIAKNYLQAAEIDELNRIVVMYLDYAEDMARRRKAMTMREWEEKLDAFLQFNEREVLTHAGKISAQVAERLAQERYAEFDARRREAERLAADAEDVRALEQVAHKWKDKMRGKKT
ncbi:virulence RhuM family protein [Caldimonas thermodepolymerans]|jgi:Virulence protein|uniref:virulence RhuM family protein n=1 Tax=Caldimonas thermodepolymerans TaxID=215580 RepID=UPI0024906ABC|nr:virulence RhuM family protein [Caldimonas thermodepolymerans]